MNIQRHYPGWPSAVALVAAVLASPSQAAPLTLVEALRLAEDNAPSLAAEQAKLQAASSAAIPAGELPDPQLRLGVQNYPVGGPERWSIDRAVANLGHKLLEEFIVVALVCALFLWHLRSSLVAIISLPIGVLIAFIVMRHQGINANLMSLGGIAIAIGAMVDAAVVMIGNAHKKVEAWHAAHPGETLTGERHWQVMTDAATEVGPALFFCLLIMATLPFALTGGVWFLYLLGYNLSVATSVGFIALAGVAAELGVIMLLYLKNAWAACEAAGEHSEQALLEAIRQGAVQRVRPKTMTVAVIVAGLLPIFWGSGTGSEIMSRIAAPMVGGMLSAPLLSLFVIPAAYRLMRRPNPYPASAERPSNSTGAALR